MRAPSGIEQRLGGHLAVDPVAEHLDGDRRAGRGVLGRQVGVGDRAPDGVAVAARGHAPRDPAAHPHGLVAEGDRARVLEQQAAQPPGRRAAVERRAAEELLVELHAEAEPGLVGRLVGRHVRAPHAIALLQPQRVDRAVAAGAQPVRAPGLPQRAPERRAVLHRAVELPAELAHVGHAQRAHRHVADRQLAQRHVAEGRGRRCRRRRARRAPAGPTARRTPSAR